MAGFIYSVSLRLNLAISNDNTLSKSNEIISTVKTIIPTALYQSNTANNVLKFTLPFNEQSKFSQLFLELEKLKDFQVHFQKNFPLFSKLNLQMVSLEEAFISLGLNPDLLIEKTQRNLNEKIEFGRQMPPTTLFGGANT